MPKRQPLPVTHGGARCATCTSAPTVHANNVHLTTPKAVTRWTPCPSGCQHPLTAEQSPGTHVRIQAPGATVALFGPTTGHTATVVARPSYAPQDEQVWVQVQPSFRRGVSYDLASYAPAWVHPLTAEEDKR